MDMMYVLIGIVVLIALVIVMTYNSLVGKRNDVKNIYASVDTQLKQRYDLIPNLVASAKAFMQHEKDLLENITKLRQEAISSSSDKEKFITNNQLTHALNGLKIQLENYPDIKSNENIINLQNSLKECEEQISAARRAYNSSVTIYNNACEMFPTNLIAAIFSFKKAEVFEATQEERANINVNELFK